VCVCVREIERGGERERKRESKERERERESQSDSGTEHLGVKSLYLQLILIGSRPKSSGPTAYAPYDGLTAAF
jgi:hypothetical protein